MPGSNSVAKLKDEQEVWPLRLHVVPRPLDNSAARQTVADASAAPLPNMAAGQDSLVSEVTPRSAYARTGWEWKAAAEHGVRTRNN